MLALSEHQQLPVEDLRFDLIGINSLFPLKTPKKNDIHEVRLRVAGRTRQQAEAQQIANEVEALYTNGPAGGGGATKKVDEVISVASVLVPRTDIQTSVIYKKIS